MTTTTATATGLEEKLQEDHVYTITTTSNTTNNNSSNKVKVLEYNSYLAHQRYYDDLKHVDITYIDYGYFPHNNSSGEKGKEEGGGRVVIEQRKRLGKGGFCWDAAFILGEHVISLEEEWNNRSVNSNSNKKRTPANVLELGAGTGLCGIMIGTATNSHVTITDLPELQDLMAENVRRNFGHDDVKEKEGNVDDANDVAAVELSDEERKLITHLDDGTKSQGTVKSRVLRWGNEEDYFLQEDDQQQQHGGQQAYDVIIGADIVASLYDPIALAQTLHALCGPTTKIYISSKSRLDKPHEEFDTEMTRLFTKVVKKGCPCSRLKTPDVFIIEAEGKRDI